MLTLKQKIHHEAGVSEPGRLILGRLFREVDAFADVSESAKKARRSETLADPFAFFTTYLPHYFSQEFVPFHHELVEMLEQRPPESREQWRRQRSQGPRRVGRCHDGKTENGKLKTYRF